MKRVFKQWLAGLLSVVLLFTLLPAASLAEEAGGAAETAVERVQALIDELPEAEGITAENRADVQAQIDAIDAAMLELTGDQAAALDTARYDAAVAALLALDTPTALEQVQALIDALPDADTITADNRADVEAQLTAIDEAKLGLEDEELDTLDITRYMAAVEAISALDGMAGANEPRTIATTVSNIPYMEFCGGNYTNSNWKSGTSEVKTCLSATKVESDTTTWTEGWYVVEGSVVINERIKTQGNVHLILKDGCTLTATKGISVTRVPNDRYTTYIEESTLTIHGQSKQTGKLIALSNPENCAAIGADANTTCGEINIIGATVEATTTNNGGYCIGKTDGKEYFSQYEGPLRVYRGHFKLNCGNDRGCFGYYVTRYIVESIIEYSESVSCRGYRPGSEEHSESMYKDTFILGKNFDEPRSGIVYGNATLPENYYTVPAGGKLTVRGGGNLSVPHGSTLKVEAGGTLQNDGQITNNGTVDIWGNLEGNGSIAPNPPVDHYKLEVMALSLPDAAYGASPTEQVIRITNTGTEDLGIESVTVDKDFDIVSGSTYVRTGTQNISWKIKPKEKLSAGDHNATITVTYNSGRKATGAVTFKVTKAVPTVNVSVSGNLTYGSEMTLTAKVTAPNVGTSEIADNVTFKAGTAELGTVKAANGTATLTIAANNRDLQHKLFGTDGKNVTVTAEYAGNGNIDKNSGTATKVTVNPKTLTFKFTAATRPYDKTKNVTGTFEPSGVLSGDNVNVSDYTATVESENVGNDKTVTASVTKLGGTDEKYYTPGAVTGGTVTISKAGISSVTAPTAKELTYNGGQQDLVTAPAKPDEGTMMYALGDESHATSDYSENIPKAKDTGTYYVWYYVKGDDNHNNSVEGKVSVTIEQKTVTLTWDGYSGLTYSGNPVNVTATADTGISGESVNVTVENGENTNAGTYTAKAIGLTDGEGGKANNYKLPAGVTQEYTITPAPVSFAIGDEDKTAWPTDEANADPNPDGYTLGGGGTAYALSMTYDSYDHKASVAQTEGETVKIEAGAVNGFSVTYKRIKDAAGGEVTEDAKDSVRDAGTYEIWVTINPTGDNIYNYVFSGHGEARSLKIGEITVEPFPTAVSWAHLKYVYHGHPMHPEIRVLSPFKNDNKQMTSGLPTDFNHENPEAYTGDYLVAFAETSGSDVGVYPVTVALYGKNAGNYTITDPTEDVTIVPAPVTITVGDNTWVVQEDGTLSQDKVTPRPAWGAVTSAPDQDEGTDHQYPLAGSAIKADLDMTVDYWKDGEKVEDTPTEPGTYEVWVTIGNPNFRHSGATGGVSHNVGELVITNDPDSVKSYTVTFDPNYEGAPDGPKDLTGVFANQTVVLPPVSGENEDESTYNIARKGWSFLGWSYNGHTYKPNEEFHMPAGDVTFKAEWIEAVPVGGTVKQGNDENAAALPGATVTLKQGAEDVAEAVTDENGAFDFGLVTPGIYNLEVRYRSGDTEIVKTFLVEAGGEDGMPEVYLMPDKALNTVVEVAPGITAAVNLDRITGSQETSEVYMEADKKTVEDGGKVEFKMSVSGGKLTPEQTEEVPVPADRIGMVLDLELTKTVKESGGEPSETDIHDTKSPVTTVIHLPAELQGKSSYTIYRFHDMNNKEGNETLVMQTITTSPNSDGEYLEIVRDGTAIEIHADFYSTYVLTWEQSSGGGGSSRVVIPAETAHGKITSDLAFARRGSKVTLTATPEEGYHLGTLTVTDWNGKPVELTDNGDGTYTFTMPYGKVTVKAEFVKCGSLDFTDLDTAAWYHEYADHVIAHGLMRGIGGGLFAPDGTVTRAQMVTVLWNMSDKPVVNYYMTYSDVSEGVWYSEAIRWATSEGIVGGYGKGKFGPNDPITRQQMAVMIYRYEQKYGDGGFTGDWMYRLPFTDLDQISDWAFESVAWCNMKGVIKGKGNGVFDPKGLAKRSEMAAILTRCDGLEME